MSGLVLSRRIGEGVYLLTLGQPAMYVSVTKIQDAGVRASESASVGLRFEGSRGSVIMRDEIVVEALTESELAHLTEVPISQELLARFRRGAR